MSSTNSSMNSRLAYTLVAVFRSSQGKINLVISFLFKISTLSRRRYFEENKAVNPELETPQLLSLRNSRYFRPEELANYDTYSSPLIDEVRSSLLK